MSGSRRSLNLPRGMELQTLTARRRYRERWCAAARWWLPLGGGARRLLGARGCRRRVLARHSGRLGPFRRCCRSRRRPPRRSRFGGGGRPPWGRRRGGALATGCGSLRTRFAGEQRLLDVLEVLADGLAHAAQVLTRIPKRGVEVLEDIARPLVQLLTKVLERFLGGLDRLREPVHRSLPGALGAGRSAAHAAGHGRSLGHPESPLCLSRFTFPPKSDPKLGFAQPQTACGQHPAMVERVMRVPGSE